MRAWGSSIIPVPMSWELVSEELDLTESEINAGYLTLPSSTELTVALLPRIRLSLLQSHHFLQLLPLQPTPNLHPSSHPPTRQRRQTLLRHGQRRPLLVPHV